MDFDAIASLKADAVALQQLAELAERLAAREDLDVIRIEARLLALDRRRTQCLREERDAFAQSSALYAERLALRQRRGFAPAPLNKRFSTPGHLNRQPGESVTADAISTSQ